MSENLLLQWTLEAKRALQHAEQLSSRANVLISESGTRLDRAESLVPKCMFLKDALHSQVGLLDRLGGGCYTVEQHARREVEVFIKELDSLDIDLNEILSQLKSAPLDPGFDEANAVELRQNPPRKVLHDFVDEHGIEELKTQLRQAIDEVQDSHDILSSSLTTLSAEVRDLKNLVDSIQLPPPLPPLSPSESAPGSQSQTYATHSEKQGYHAHHLALLLTSLAQHYDQTSTALKEHESPLGQVTNIDNETIDILFRDAGEVKEVLEEMDDHVRELGHSSNILQTYCSQVDDMYKAITNIFLQIEEYGTSRLPLHLASVKDFESRAAAHREHIQTLKQQMFDLVQYYTNFSTAYAALLIEVRRRTEAQTQTLLRVNEISAKLTSWYDQEVRARKAFMDRYAAFLPVDLWKGIVDPPPRSTVHTDEGGILPVLRDQGKRLSSASMERRKSGQMTGSGDSVGRRSTESSGRRSGESSVRR